MPEDLARSDKQARPAYDGPPDYRLVGKHAMMPGTSHDEAERFNFLAQMNRHLASRVMPGVKAAFETRVEPAHVKAQGAFRNRHEVRKALLKDPAFQWWSALRRATMEQRQEAGRWVCLRQAGELNEKARKLTEGDPRLELKEGFAVPRYLTAVDHHLMPGSYHTERAPGDVTGPANYDLGIFATTGGALGRYNDGGGHAVVAWVKRNLPGFAPKRILDLGAGLGHNVLPIAQAFPEAEVVAVDAGAPMLRYGLARAKSLGIENVRFVQADAEDLSRFEDESFDWIQTTMFLHETSKKAMEQIFAETRRLLKPGGIVLHVEQPQYSDTMTYYEQAMRDWDAFYNNEPFWTTMHEIDLDDLMIKAGFGQEKILHDGVAAVVDTGLFPAPDTDEVEDYGRKAAWHVIGAQKKTMKKTGEAA
ncbi:class I SAM-dependent methyltransferase [Marinicauda algicola]|uniref:Class I SAM-dependent methyltransferase n=1 Tax=Marinicauda algicola TaxID=2029849 RepID=A0A4S2H463_9PROT|nr:class I SAM-dependent methyltransferase [Marinicauda algicola]TGY90188.1 class I SAM-dependent methyltransferase [Marinicauda algicola]